MNGLCHSDEFGVEAQDRAHWYVPLLALRAPTTGLFYDFTFCFC